ncbi:hypothetical protein CL617_04665 [archaeon]|nr:hypothetical protein [archaeon]|tara:strand:- start:3448 stop:3690 length:243 start_codon:yes stop_codon:yes gene_type:complete
MEIPTRRNQTWDGSSKLYTKNCSGCDFYREINSQDLCGHGVAFKILDKIENPIACAVKDNELELFKKHSVEYLDSLISKL